MRYMGWSWAELDATPASVLSELIDMINEDAERMPTSAKEERELGL